MLKNDKINNFNNTSTIRTIRMPDSSNQKFEAGNEYARSNVLSNSKHTLASENSENTFVNNDDIKNIAKSSTILENSRRFLTIKDHEFLIDFFKAGSLAICTKTLSAPFERVRSILQSQNEIKRIKNLTSNLDINNIIRPNNIVGQEALSSSSSSSSSSSIFSLRRIIAYIYRSEGFAGFFRGNLPNIIRYFPTQGLNFAINSELKKLELLKPQQQKQQSLPNSDNDNNAIITKRKAKKLAYYVTIGGISGASSTILCYSLDFSRIQLCNDILINSAQSVQKQGDFNSNLKQMATNTVSNNSNSNKGAFGGRNYRGMLDVYRKTYSTDGIQGLNRGLGTSIVKMFIYRGAYFGIYDFMKEAISIGNSFQQFCLAYCTTLSSGLIIYPIDTLNKRLVMIPARTASFSNALRFAFNIIGNEGFLALYRGASVFAFRSFAGASILFFNDMLK